MCPLSFFESDANVQQIYIMAKFEKRQHFLPTEPALSVVEGEVSILAHTQHFPGACPER